MFERYIETVYSLAALLFVSSPELLKNLTLVNWQEPAFQHAILMIFALPLSWNVLARTEYHYKLLRKLACGSKRLACYMLALYIFVVGQYRSAVAEIALRNQPHMSLLPSRLCSLLTGCSSDTADFYLGWAIIMLGQALVLPSMWKLGIVGTYLGDYCGIYLPARVSGYPFNILDNPMYVGTTISFVGGAIMKRSPAGLVLSMFVHFVYRVVIMWEEPFTSMIYQKKAEEEEAAAAAAAGKQQ